MEYMCLDCNHHWKALEAPSGYRQCPNLNCRSRDVVPASFWSMVDEGRRLGIRHTTPFRDLIKAAQAVGAYESLLVLGWVEFRRVMGRVVREIEKPRE